MKFLLAYLELFHADRRLHEPSYNFLFNFISNVWGSFPVRGRAFFRNYPGRLWARSASNGYRGSLQGIIEQGVKLTTYYVEIKCQLDATEVFIADLIACSTCFGHHYAHHQELKSIIQWLLRVVFCVVVFQVAGLVWSKPDA